MNFTEIITILEGKKTYIAAIIAAGFNILLAFGMFDLTPEQITAIECMFGAILGTTIRLGIKKAEK